MKNKMESIIGKLEQEGMLEEKENSNYSTTRRERIICIKIREKEPTIFYQVLILLRDP